MAKTKKIDKRVPPEFQNHYNYNPSAEGHTEKFTKPSETVPDQTMGIREILDRFTRGQKVQTLKPVWYDENNISEFEGHFDKMDRLERIDYLKEVKQSIKAQQDGIAEKLTKLKQDKLKKAAAEKAERKVEQVEKRTQHSQESVIDPPKEEAK